MSLSYYGVVDVVICVHWFVNVSCIVVLNPSENRIIPVAITVTTNTKPYSSKKHSSAHPLSKHCHQDIHHHRQKQERNPKERNYFPPIAEKFSIVFCDVKYVSHLVFPFHYFKSIVIEKPLVFPLFYICFHLHSLIYVSKKQYKWHKLAQNRIHFAFHPMLGFMFFLYYRI